MQLPCSEELNIEYLGRLFDNTSECYKFFWFKAIVAKVTEGKQEISYEELVDGIDKVKLSDAKAWLIKLQRVDGKGYSSIHTIRGVLRPAFQMAEEDDLIRKNPFGFELVNVIVNDSVRREAVTRKQEREFLRFIKEYAHFCKYYDAIFILYGRDQTGNAAHKGQRYGRYCRAGIRKIRRHE